MHTSNLTVTRSDSFLHRIRHESNSRKRTMNFEEKEEELEEEEEAAEEDNNNNRNNRHERVGRSGKGGTEGK